MTRYYLVTIGIYLLAILVAAGAMVVLPNLILNATTPTILEQVDSPSLAVGVTAIAVIAPVVAVMEALISWLRLWREARLKAELVKVIDAQSSSPRGMDLSSLQRETKLPRKVLQDRVNELILLGRIGVKIKPDNQREYYLIGAV
jgi:hypothetical protein